MASPELILRAVLEIADYLERQLSETKQAWYVEGLADLRDEAVEALPRQVRQTWRYPSMPLIADLRALAGHGESDEDRTERAWLAWREAARRIGAYRSLLCEDGALGAAVEAVFGNWPAACVAEYDPPMWASKRKEFGRVYHASQGQSPRYLLGLHERENRDKGLLQAAYVGVLEVGGEIRQASLSPGQSPLALLSYEGPRALPAREEPIGMDEARSLWQRVRSAVQVRARGDAA